MVNFTPKIGDIPTLYLPAPKTLTGKVSAAVLLAATAYVGNHIYHGNFLLFIVIVALLGLLFWLYAQHNSRSERNGYLFNEPADSALLITYQPLEQGEINPIITEHLQTIDGLEHCKAIESRTAQYKIYAIRNNDPDKIAAQMGKIAMKLGAIEDEMLFIKNYKPHYSALLNPLPPTQWQTVHIDESALKQGHLIGYIGMSINGDAITYNRQHDPHLQISGTTNSGKTEAIRVDIACMHKSGLNPEIHIIDPKDDMGDIAADFYTDDLAIATYHLETLCKLGDVRKKAFSKAGCKNWFEYQAKHPEKATTEYRPIFIYVDEGADLMTEDKTEERERDEHPQHKRAESALWYITRKLRAAGMFLTFATQNPKADVVPTNIRNNLNAKLALRVVDRTASGVALDATGAEKLQNFGGFMFRSSQYRAPVTGRGAYIE